MESLVVIKIGGNIIDDEVKLKAFLSQFSTIEGYKILVHGGGKIATAIGDRLGIVSKYVDGRRITDAETLDLVTMVYGGLINKKIVAQLQSNTCNAIGLTGADGNILLAVKRPVKEVDYGFVGDIKETGVNTTVMHALLKSGLTPVIAPLTHNGNGSILNTNADTIAQEIAKAMAAVMPTKLIYCFEKKGLLMNVDDDTSVITDIDAGSYVSLKEKNIISGGMIPKLENAFEAIRKNVSTVTIGHADDIQLLISGKAGTNIR
jgi:acetylglutamate kinase